METETLFSRVEQIVDPRKRRGVRHPFHAILKLVKIISYVLLLSVSTLFAQKAPFASTSDLVTDLSDGLLNDIYHHRLGFESCGCKRSASVEGFGNYRQRDSSSDRSRYENWFAGVLGELNPNHPF